MAFMASKGLRMYLVLDNLNEKKVLLQSLTKFWVKFLRPESTRHQRKINYKKLNFSIFIIILAIRLASTKSDHTHIYIITLIPRNITSQLQCICASAAGTSAIPVTDE